MNRKKAKLANDVIDDKSNSFNYEFTKQDINSFLNQIEKITEDKEYSIKTYELLAEYLLTNNGLTFNTNYAFAKNKLELKKLLKNFSYETKCLFILTDYDNKKRLIVLNNNESTLEILYIRHENIPESSDSIHHLINSFSAEDDKTKRYLQHYLRVASVICIDAHMVNTLQNVAQCLNTTKENSLEDLTFTEKGVEEIIKYKEELKLKIRATYINHILKSVKSLEQKPDLQTFRNELNIFLQDCHEFESMLPVFENYAHECKDVFDEDDDINEQELANILDKLKSTREKLLADQKVEELISKSKKRLDTLDTKEENSLIPDVFQTFPEYMEIVVNTLKLLPICKNSDIKNEIESSLVHVLHVKEEYIKYFCNKISNDSNETDNFNQQMLHEEKDNECITNDIDTEEASSSSENSMYEKNIIPSNDNIVTNTDDAIKTRYATSEQDLEVVDNICYEEHVDPDANFAIKTLEEIISELKISIGGIELTFLNSEDIKNIKRKVQRIKNINMKWKNRTERDIKMWIKSKASIIGTDIEEMIAILDRGNELITEGQKLRIPQIIALLILLDPSLPNINISQIQTGEGKTTLISLLAIIKIWLGYPSIDIVTSNSVLAEEGLNSKQKLYKLCNITASTNNGDNTYRSGPRDCYNSQIVYGTMSMFQFDHLRNTFESLNTKGARQFSFLIVDEVDSMLIDNANHIAKLASHFPGMDYLRYVYIKIWQELYKAECSIQQKLQNELHEEIAELSKKYKLGNLTLQEMESEISYCEERIQKLPYDYLYQIVTDNVTLDKFSFLPEHILAYAKSTLKKWIKNAIYAKYSCHENEMYIVEVGKDGKQITPVDAMNTGMTLKNTVWHSGLHQFLQIKHNLRITSETLTSSCISNIAYIQKYKRNMIGVTGTLGSQAEQIFLATVYNVNFAFIPTFKTKIFMEQDCKVVLDEDWCHEVASNAIQKVYQSRAVLIICKTIADADSLSHYVESFLYNDIFGIDINLRLYKDESFCAVTRDEVNPGTIIIATNIAGRGADFKTSPILEAHGGLHVCVSYLPGNERVKEQAYFRTSRQGMKGSAQMIIRDSEAKTLQVTKNEKGILRAVDVKEKMENNETIQIQFLLNTKLNELKILDALFEKFSELYIQQVNKFGSDSEYHHYLLDLKERWAFWLEKQKFDGRKYSIDEVENIFEIFLSEEYDRKEGMIDTNPYYCIQQAEYYIENDKLDKALISLTHATKICKNSTVLSAVPLKQFEIILEKNPVLYNRIMKALNKIVSLGFYEGDENITKVDELLPLLESSKSSLLIEIDYLKINCFANATDFQNILVTNQSTGINEMTRQIETRYMCLQKQFQYLKSLFEQFKNADNSKGYSIAAKVKVNHKEITEMISNNNKTNENETATDQDNNNCNTDEENAIQKLEPQTSGTNVTNFSISSDKSASTFLPHVLSLTSATSTLSTYNCRELENYVNNQPKSNQENKAFTASREIEELEATGLSYCYAVNEVKDIPSKLIGSSLAVVASGVAVLLAGIAFPPIFLVSCGLANVLISEGIVDIVIEFVKPNSEDFDAKEYIKAKATSFAISAITCGITAALTCQKVLQKAINVCKKLQSALKNCSKFKYIVKKLTTLLENMITCLKKLKEAAILASNTNKLKFNNMSKLNIFKQAMWKIGRNTFKSAVNAVIMEKVVTNYSKLLFEQCKDKIAKNVESNLLSSLNREKLRTANKEEIFKLCKELLYGTEKCVFLDVTEKISIGVVKQIGSKINSLLLFVCELFWDVYKSVEFIDAFGGFSNEFNEKLECLEGKQDNNEQYIIKELSQMIANAICTRLERIILGKYASLGTNTATSILVNKVIPINDNLYVDGKPITDDAHEFLEINKNASDEERLQAYLQKCEELKRQGSENSDLLLDRLQLAMQSCEKLYLINRSNSNCVFQSLSQMFDVDVSTISGATGFVALPEGVSIQDATKMLKNLNLTTCKRTFENCDEKAVADYLSHQNSNYATFFIKGNENEVGHAVTVESEGNTIYVHDVSDGNKVKTPWSEYALHNDVAQGTLLTAKNLNDKRTITQIFININKNLYPEEEKRAGESLFQNRIGISLKKEMYSYVIRDGELYQDNNIKIAVGGNKQKDVMKQLYSILNEYAEEVNKAKPRHQRKKIENSNTTYIFGYDHENSKSQMMLGIFDVTLSNGEKLKFITSSGSNPLAVRQKWQLNKDTGYPEAKETIPIKVKVDGYEFIHPKNPIDMNIVDLSTGDITNKKHTSSCAAQKGTFFIGEKLTEYNKTGLKVKVESIQMREQWYATPGSKNASYYSRTQSATSCSKCKHDLSYSTGKDSNI